MYSDGISWGTKRAGQALPSLRLWSVQDLIYLYILYISRRNVKLVIIREHSCCQACCASLKLCCHIT